MFGPKFGWLSLLQDCCAHHGFFLTHDTPLLLWLETIQQLQEMLNHAALLDCFVAHSVLSNAMAGELDCFRPPISHCSSPISFYDKPLPWNGFPEIFFWTPNLIERNFIFHLVQGGAIRVLFLVTQMNF